jgi:hypothetical protein
MKPQKGKENDLSPFDIRILYPPVSILPEIVHPCPDFAPISLI